MGLFKSLILRLKKEKIIITKHPGDILTYKDFSFNNVKSLTVIGPLCKRDMDRIVDIIKTKNTLSTLNLKDTSELLEISNKQFHACDCLEKIILPEGLKRIGESAFEYCRNLREVEIPNELQIISKSAFYGCTSLTKIEIPKGVKTIGDWAFGCNNLREIIVDKNNRNYKSIEGVLYTINGDTLIKYPCKKANTDFVIYTINGDTLAKYPKDTNTDFVIPECVQHIARGAFQDCTQLEEIKLSSGLKDIGDNAFINTSLTEVNIPDGVISVGKMAYSHCTLLKKVTIPGSISHLGERAFTECHKLKDVTVGDGITGIGDNVFANCHSLTRVDLPASAYIVND